MLDALFDAAPIGAVPTRMLQVECQHCQGLFYSRDRNHKFCTAKCKNALRNVRIRQNRRVAEMKVLTCKVCDSSFEAVMARANYCSKKCAGRHSHATRSYAHTCAECGKAFSNKQSKATCCSRSCLTNRLSRCAREQQVRNPMPRKWESRSDAYRHYGYKRRALVTSREFEQFSSAEIFERDGWLCQICDEEVDRDLRFPHPRSASLDHKVPVSKGGKHVRNNVQCAHFGCNSRKGNSYSAEAVA